MSTQTVRKPAKQARPKKSSGKIPAWLGRGEGKAFVKPGVDLTKPTLPPGKYL